VKIILFGASGMVGQGVLYECLHDPDVSDVLVIGRSALEQKDPKLRALAVPNVGDLSRNESDVTGYDACFFCLGVSSVGMSEADYKKVTYDLTVGAATTLARLNPGMTFTYVSGKGTDSSEKGKQMWARVKGATENALLRMPFKAAYMFRPGAIQPMHGEKPRAAGARLLLTILGPLIPLVMGLSAASVTTTERIGRAMLIAAKRGAPKRVLESADINALAGAG
jgi:uncharacterized protein YbjT (DUF2867 family)